MRASTQATSSRRQNGPPAHAQAAGRLHVCRPCSGPPLLRLTFPFHVRCPLLCLHPSLIPPRPLVPTPSEPPVALSLPSPPREIANSAPTSVHAREVIPQSHLGPLLRSGAGNRRLLRGGGPLLCAGTPGLLEEERRHARGRRDRSLLLRCRRGGCNGQIRWPLLRGTVVVRAWQGALALARLG